MFVLHKNIQPKSSNSFLNIFEFMQNINTNNKKSILLSSIHYVYIHSFKYKIYVYFTFYIK